MCKGVANCFENNWNEDLCLSFSKLGYMMTRYIPTVKDVDFKNGLIKEPVKYDKERYRKLATISCSCFCCQETAFSSLLVTERSRVVNRFRMFYYLDRIGMRSRRVL